MTTLISPSAGPSAAASLATRQADPRGRGAPASEAQQGQAFGAMLDRTRAAGRNPAPASAPAVAAEAAAPKKAVRADDDKDELPSELVALALLSPAPVALDARAAPRAGAGGPATAAAASAAPALDTDAVGAQAMAASLAESAVEGDTADTAARPPLPASGELPDAQALPAQTTALQAAATTARLPQDAIVTGTDAPTDGMASLPALAARPPAKPAPTGASMLAAAAERQARALPESGTDIQSAATPAAAPIAGALAAAAFERLDPASAASTSEAPVSLASLPQMPPAAERAGAPAAALPVLTVAPPVGSPEWGPAMGQQMIRMHAGGQQTAELHLNPAGLGPLKVTLSIGDNQAQAMFVSAHESVRKAVEAALPQLRSALAEQGISLGQTSVGADSRQWAGQPGGFDQQQQQQHHGQGGSVPTAYPAATRLDAASPAVAAAVRSASGSGVDTFA